MSKAVLQPRKAKATNHYINNDRMLQEITPYHEAWWFAEHNGLAKPRIPEYIGECIIQIATRLAQKPQFRNYSFVEEMIDDAIENCVQYAFNFNPKKSTYVFSYFTKMVFYAFVRRIQKEKKQSYIKHKVFEKYYMYDEVTQKAAEHVDQHNKMDYYEIERANFVEDFEQKQEIKKNKAKAKSKVKSSTNAKSQT